MNTGGGNARAQFVAVHTPDVANVALENVLASEAVSSTDVTSPPLHTPVTFCGVRLVSFWRPSATHSSTYHHFSVFDVATSYHIFPFFVHVHAQRVPFITFTTLLQRLSQKSTFDWSKTHFILLCVKYYVTLQSDTSSDPPDGVITET